MTRTLSALLGVEPLSFRDMIQRLEASKGHPSADIRITTDVAQRSRQALHFLGLAKQDTTPEELYAVLKTRILHDDQTARQALGVAVDAAPSEVVVSAARAVERLCGDQRVLGMKNSVAKRLLKKVPPKRTLKQLGYRSLDSMLKHEPAAAVYTAATLIESATWKKRFRDQYIGLTPHDFEERTLEIHTPQAERWHRFSDQLTRHHKQTVFAAREFGAVIALPTEVSLPSFALVQTLLCAQAASTVYSVSVFFKLQQMKPEFGAVVLKTVNSEPTTVARLLERPVSWYTIHQFYGRAQGAFNQSLLEPHIQPADMVWLHPEAILARLHPSLEFWTQTVYTALVRDGVYVSLNVLDAALNVCNSLPFGRHHSTHMRHQLWQELMLRYLDLPSVEAALAGEFREEPTFVLEPVRAS